MNIAITSYGSELSSEPSPIFGRAPYFLFVDTDTRLVDAVANPSVDAPSGAGIQAARLVIDRGVRTVLTGRIGPKAARVLEAAGVEIREMGGTTASELLDRFLTGRGDGAKAGHPRERNR